MWPSTTRPPASKRWRKIRTWSSTRRRARRCSARFESVKSGGVVVTIGGRPDGKFARAWGLSLPLVWSLGFLNRKGDHLARKQGARFEYLFMRASGEQLE